MCVPKLFASWFQPLMQSFHSCWLFAHSVFRFSMSLSVRLVYFNLFVVISFVCSRIVQDRCYIHERTGPHTPKMPVCRRLNKYVCTIISMFFVAMWRKKRNESLLLWTIESNWKRANSFTKQLNTRVTLCKIVLQLLWNLFQNVLQNRQKRFWCRRWKKICSSGMAERRQKDEKPNDFQTEADSEQNKNSKKKLSSTPLFSAAI